MVFMLHKRSLNLKFSCALALPLSVMIIIMIM